jgi:hypothetical protein
VQGGPYSSIVSTFSRGTSEKLAENYFFRTDKHNWNSNKYKITNENWVLQLKINTAGLDFN